MTLINVFAILVVGYRFRRRLLTRAEIALLVLWLVHGMMVEAQLLVECKVLKVDWRYLDPANAMLWPWAAWGIVRLWQRLWPRRVIIATLSLFAAVNGVMVVKHLFPIGRRARVVTVCREASRHIRADWTGPARDEYAEYSSAEYHPVERPVVEGPRSFKAARRLLGVMSGGRSAKPGVFPASDLPDYWLLDAEEAAPDNSESVDAFQYGKYSYRLYRRK